jgi:hypothetical protein
MTVEEQKQRENCGQEVTHFTLGVRKGIILFQDSQAMPSCPSDKDSENE